VKVPEQRFLHPLEHFQYGLGFEHLLQKRGGKLILISPAFAARAFFSCAGTKGRLD
jgi:hypothetical protein